MQQPAQLSGVAHTSSAACRAFSHENFAKMLHETGTRRGSSLPSSSISQSVDTCARPQVAEHESGGGDKGGGGEGGGEGGSGWQQPSQTCGWSHITLAALRAAPHGSGSNDLQVTP